MGSLFYFEYFKLHFVILLYNIENNFNRTYVLNALTGDCGETT